MYQKILVPLDGSVKSELSLPVVRQLVQSMHSQVYLLVSVDLGHVLFVEENATLPANLIKLKQQQVEEAKKYLEQLQERLKAEGFEVHIQVEQADPRDAIRNFVLNQGIDLIVMTSAGKNNWMRWISGSIADQVLRSSPCPVLVVRPPLSEQTQASD